MPDDSADLAAGRWPQPQRRRLLLDRLERDGRVVASTIATELMVSEDTIRRDLRDLAEAGQLQRYHGGAIRCAPDSGGFRQRQTEHVAAKEALARAALPLLRTGMVVLFDQSTTLLALARSLGACPDITLVTPAPDIALAASDAGVRDVIMVGGRLDPERRCVTGASLTESLGRLRADLCFLGVCAIDAEAGLSAPDYEEACMKRALIAASASVAALTLSERAASLHPHLVAPLAALDYLLCSDTAPPDLIAACDIAGTRLITAPLNDATSSHV